MKHLFVVLALMVVGAPSFAQEEEDAPPKPKIKSCLDDPGYHELDFWLGTWDVQIDGKTVGTNRIERILRGCAVMEHWESSRGDKGKSLFTYDRINETWKQVWVTDGAFSPGGLKEKVLIERFDDGGMRFEGQILLDNGDAYLDRTTLRPLPGGKVHQLIEISYDDGFNWTPTFDAIYVRALTGR